MTYLQAVKIPGALKSKRFWTMLLEAMFLVAVSVVPELEVYAEQLIEASVIVAGLVIGGFSLEDAAVAFKAGEHKEKYK
jgi:hypothetical protein